MLASVHPHYQHCGAACLRQVKIVTPARIESPLASEEAGIAANLTWRGVR